MLKGFKDFLLRGNVVDLAVAVIIGAAFTAIVTAFTTNIIQPLINALGGKDAVKGLGVEVIAGNPATFINLGAVINATINFIIVAAVVYFLIVMPIKRLMDRRKAQGDDAAGETEAELLAEIRDLLRQGR